MKGLYCIVGSHLHFSPSKMAQICLEGGASIIQLRMKNSKKEEILNEGKKIFGLKKKYSFTFIVNDDPQMALELDADGVHLGQEDLLHVGARRALPLRDSGKIIGVSTHSIEDVQRSLTLSLYPSPLPPAPEQPRLRRPSEGEGQIQERKINYLALGAIFKSPTKNKKDHPVVGIELLKKVVAFSPIPVVAIGGIDRNNIEEVIKTSVHSVALISALDAEGKLNREEDIIEEVRFFVRKFQHHRAGILRI